MDLIITSRILIPSNELKWRFSRSSGSGGQNVNKNDTRVELIFNIEESKVLNTYQKILLKEKLKNRVLNNCIIIVVQDMRYQYQNRLIALKRLKIILRDGLKNFNKMRKFTKPTIASNERRINSKKKRGELKKNRKNL